ncbi:MAG: CoA transferase, partial [Deltaproteobacteria bacterium]|nr:CoA transferase [Deltaproteobacteria bacterium]
NITVLDISRLLPGGFASLLLVRLGARVIKVEEPGVGDYYRGLTGGKEFIDLGHFQEINSGKELVTLDLKSAADTKIFRRLVQKADIVIENFRPGTLKRLGIPYRVLSRWNRKIVLCSVTGSGQKGASHRLGGHDLNYFALSGLLSLNKGRQKRPTIPEFQIIDLAAGYRSTVLILAALQQRNQTGRGSWIDSSMLAAGKEMARLYHPFSGTDLLDLPNYQLYRTRDDRLIAFAGLEPKFIRNFGRAIGDPKIAGKAGASVLEKIFRSKTVSQWTRLNQKYDFCLSPVLTVTEACGPRKRGDRLPPMGRDNLKVLRRLGYSKKKMRELRKEGVL